MREIKFRAWESDNKCMLLPEELYLDECLKDKDVVLMQYTGLKDKNGKEIYEGDIIEVSNDKTGEVIFSDGQFMNKNTGWGLHTYLRTPEPFSVSVIEIIGNIYENPELLK